jgi:hypothetical protein
MTENAKPTGLLKLMTGQMSGESGMPVVQHLRKNSIKTTTVPRRERLSAAEIGRSAVAAFKFGI